jgi:hypothetical protein
MTLPSWLGFIGFGSSISVVRHRRRTPVQHRRTLALESLEDRMVPSASHGGLDIFSVSDRSGSAGIASVTRLDTGSQHADFASGLAGSGGLSLAPRGPGYPSPPATGPALRGDTKTLFSFSPVAVNLQGSDVAVVPALAAAPAVGGATSFLGQMLTAPAKAEMATEAPSGTVTSLNGGTFATIPNNASILGTQSESETHSEISLAGIKFEPAVESLRQIASQLYYAADVTSSATTDSDMFLRVRDEALFCGVDETAELSATFTPESETGAVAAIPDVAAPVTDPAGYSGDQSAEVVDLAGDVDCG